MIHSNEIYRINKSKPWFSIIIPIYNAEKSLRKCIDSIMKQTFNDFEVILIDDGSTDFSSQICEEYVKKDERVKYIKKMNGGSFQARIFGTKYAKGKYITFCDADDFYADKKVFECLFKETSGKDYSVIQFNHWKKYNHLWRKSGTIRKKEVIMQPAFLNDEYPQVVCSFWEGARLTTSVWNKLYHSSLFNNLPESESLERVFWGDDLIMNLYLLEKCRSALYLPNAFYVYNQLSGGTNKYSKHTMEDLNIIKKYQLFFLNKWNGRDKLVVENKIFIELAVWFYIYIQQSLDYLSEDELKNMIQGTLDLSSFEMARKYFLECSNENWEAIHLLREACPDEYIKAAKKAKNRFNLKSEIVSLIKTFLISI